MIYLISKQKELIPNEFYKICTVEDSLRYLNKLDEISCDSETGGFDPFNDKLLIFQLGDNKYQFVIDCTTINIKEYKSLFESNKTFIFQNAQFDLRFLYYQNIYPKNIYDTQLAEAILTTGKGDREDIKDIKDVCGKLEVAEKYADRKLGLDKIAYKYLKIEMDKDIRGIIHREGLSTRVIQYSAKDVEHLIDIKKLQKIELNKFSVKYGLTQDLIDLEMNVVKVFAKMIFNGFKLDVKKYKEEVINIVSKQQKEYKKELDLILYNSGIKSFKIPKKVKYHEITYSPNMFTEELNSNINWSSSEQKLGILQNIIPELQSTNSNILTKYKKDSELIVKLLEYNKYKKLSDSFGEKFIETVNNKTGKIHTNIWQILSTGRISMNNPNLSQIPSKGELGKIIRSCFIPRSEEYVIVGGDYTGFELAIIAEFSKDELWVDTLKAGENLHSVLCSETFDIPIEDVKKPFYANPNITYRDVQKTIDFGLAYGMSCYKLADTILVSPEEAQQIIDKFFSKVPKVKMFLDKLGMLAKKRGYSVTPMPYNRVRLFPKWDYLQKYPHIKEAGKWLGSIERAGKNSPIQGCNGDCIKKALIDVQNEIDINKWNSFILLSVYDEIQTECHISQAENWRIKLQELMINAAKTIIKEVPITVDVNINKHWTK